MKKSLFCVVLAGIMSSAALTASALITVQPGELAGPTDWLADVRLRNFNNTISDYEMMVNASPTRVIGQQQVNGQVPGNYAFAAWAQNNDFTITYDPLANWVSLRLVGSGPRQGGVPGGYDVTIGRAPDAVNPGPVNYINFQMWDRVNFPTFSSFTMSSLDGQNLGNFSIPALGIGSWSLLDPGGLALNNGFVLQGSFSLDLAKVAEGKEGDKLVWAIGHNGNVPAASVPDGGSMLAMLGLAMAGLSAIRQRLTA